MGKNPVYLITLIIVLVIGVSAYRYNDYVIQKNFALDVNTSCDPATESCFVSDCDPASDIECDTSPYKKVEITAKYAPACLEEHTCEGNFTCTGIESCEITYCSEDNVDEGETCAVQPEPEEKISDSNNTNPTENQHD